MIMVYQYDPIMGLDYQTYEDDIVINIQELPPVPSAIDILNLYHETGIIMEDSNKNKEPLHKIFHNKKFCDYLIC